MRGSHRLWLRTFLPLAMCGASLVAPAAVAAQRGIDLERFTPALDGEGFLGIQATRTPGPGRWNFSLFTSWSTNPLTVAESDGGELDVVDHRVTTDFQLQVGVGGRLALALDLPLVLHQDADGAVLGDGAGTIASNAVGDPRLVARYRFLGEDSRVVRERNEGGGVAVQVAGTLPVGDELALASERGVTAELAALADFHVLGAGVGASLGYRHRFVTRALLGVTFRDELELGVALKIPIPVTRDFLAILEVRAATDAGSPFDGPRTAVEGDFGLRLRRGDVTVTGGVGSGWTDGVGTPGFRSLLGLAWAPRIHDSDGDGITDDRDECPHLPEDFDAFQDQDGCLDPDNDNDMIPDADDRCPNEAAEEFRDEDEDGCTDPLQDADRDGVEDAEDGCPGQAEDRDGHEDDDGCPDLDDDGDGVPDAQDGCRTEPEDRDGHQDDDGCPDPDNDADGIPDAQDACPDDAEDADGQDDADGCPDPDDDRDGVADGEDRCPTQAETINGVEDGDGCPDRGGRALWRVRSPGVPGEHLLGSIAFAADHSLTPAAVAAVDQLARHLIARWPTVYVVHIASGERVRAQTLRAAIVERGVAETRVRVEPDATLQGGRVVVTRAPLAAPSAHGTPDDPPLPQGE